MKRIEWSENTGLTLQPSDIFDYFVYVIRRNSIDLGHVAEIPMVSANSIEGRSLKGHVGMMVRLIDLMDQRRTLGGSNRARAVTSRAMSGKFRLPELKLGWSLARRRRGGIFVRLGLAGDANRHDREACYLPYKTVQETFHASINLAEARDGRKGSYSGPSRTDLATFVWFSSE